MKKTIIAATFLLVLSAIEMRGDFRAYQAIPVDAQLATELQRIAAETLSEFAAEKLTEGNLSISLIDLSAAAPKRASYRGEITYHPASVVKAFYLVSLHDQIARGKVKMDDALIAAVRDMIVVSGNDSTSYVVDRISGTTSGPELEGRAYRKFVDRRNVTNRYFSAMGYDLSANGKTWCEGVYGREKQILGVNRASRNRVTSEAVASLMYMIISRRAVSPAASESMLLLMRRPVPADKPETNDTQMLEFTGESLPAGARQWSKAGWTGEVRHDMSYVELPNGRKYVLAVLTRGTAGDPKLLPEISKKIVALFSRSQ